MNRNELFYEKLDDCTAYLYIDRNYDEYYGDDYDEDEDEEYDF